MEANVYDDVNCCCHGELSYVENSLGEVINSGETSPCIWVQVILEINWNLTLIIWSFLQFLELYWTVVDLVEMKDAKLDFW